jgi:hypothetical protein
MTMMMAAMTMSDEEQDLNCQVARALGCRLERNAAGWWCRCSDGAHREWPGHLRDYLHNKEWLWDVVEQNRLYLNPPIEKCHGYNHWSVVRSAVLAANGGTMAEAVCRWIVAARKAGIEVKGAKR